MLKTVLNQKNSIQMWKELEIVEKAARIAETMSQFYLPSQVGEGYKRAEKDIAKKIREDLGLPSHNLPSLWEIVNG